MQIVNAISQVFKAEIPRIMKVDNISLLDIAKPKSSAEVVGPNVLLNSMIAFVASFMFAVGVFLVKEYLNDTVESEQDVERYLELTTLGSIRKIKKKDMQKSPRCRSKKQLGEKYASISQ
ncbi:MAG TPA: hypothetical protein VGI33_11605 [Paenibacillus sp.]|jgi:capsular polysaccharide biosynthesis protein